MKDYSKLVNTHLLLLVNQQFSRGLPDIHVQVSLHCLQAIGWNQICYTYLSFSSDLGRIFLMMMIPRHILLMVMAEV